MIFRLNTKVFEYRIGPKAFHVILYHQSMTEYRWSSTIAYPILDLSVPYRIVYTIA
jgi:hypothetical protein